MPLTTATAVRDLFGQAGEYWRGRGYEVGNVVRPDSIEPRLHASAAGYEVTLDVAVDRRLVLVEGSTPCLPGKL